ncbi:hypothetical protein ACHQM5_000761 [Ranunculus cassubicifolius]
MADDSMNRINELPDSIIVHIISFMEVDEAVATSVLSRRWGHQWRYSPSLHFPLFCEVAVINKTLNQYHAKQLQTLFIEFDVFGHPSQWLDFAIDRKVQDITVCGNDDYYNSTLFRVPDSMFSYPSLQALTLDNCEIYPPSDIKCADSLRLLSLKNVFPVDGALNCLLSKFRCLRTLELLISYDCETFEVPLSSISLYQSLQALKLENCRIYPSSDINYFDSLKVLSLKNVRLFDGTLDCLLSKCPFLQTLELSISFDENIDVPNSVFSYPSLQALTLSNCNIHPPLGIKCCDSIKHLSLTDVRSFDGAIDCLLSKFQSLKTLELQVYVDGKTERFQIPDSVFSLQSLHALTLHYCQIHPPSDIRCFDSLEELTLYNVTCFNGALDCLLSKYRRLNTIFIDSTRCKNFDVPESIFSSPFLQDLTLQNCRISPPSDIQCFESLKHLSLQSGKPFDGDLNCLLSKCRHLQTLELQDYSNDGPVNFSLDLPDLQNLTICYNSHILKIDSSKLRVLVLSGAVVEKIDIQSALHLEEVRFGILSGSKHANYLGDIAQHSMENIKTLFLTEQILDMYNRHYTNGRRIAFINLKEVHLVRVEWDRTTYSDIVRFFCDCPSLEKIQMNFSDTCHSSGGWGKKEWVKGIQKEDGRLTSEFCNENFLGHLRMIKMMDVSHDRWQFGLMKYLLGKASVLEVLHIKLNGIYGSEKWTIQDKQESMIECIHKWPKASPNAIVDIVQYVPCFDH